jgi:hypothetical protein
VSPIVLGQGGVYCALDDLWVEVASGYFNLDIIPSNREAPTIRCVLSGASKHKADANSGMSVKIKLEGLKLAGDSGKGIPKLAFESISVTLVLQANIKLVYNTVTQKWDSPPKHFQIQILSFKGPYGMTKGYVFAFEWILKLISAFKCLQDREYDFVIGDTNDSSPYSRQSST